MKPYPPIVSAVYKRGQETEKPAEREVMALLWCTLYKQTEMSKSVRKRQRCGSSGKRFPSRISGRWLEECVDEIMDTAWVPNRSVCVCGCRLRFLKMVPQGQTLHTHTCSSKVWYSYLIYRIIWGVCWGGGGVFSASGKINLIIQLPIYTKTQEGKSLHPPWVLNGENGTVALYFIISLQFFLSCKHKKVDTCATEQQNKIMQT